MRKMATIRQISEIIPIDGADAIELAKIGGWQAVIKKGEYAPGDLCCYCEIDSFIPHELAPFLSKGKEPKEFNGIRGERLRSAKFRGALSQGLILPIPSVMIVNVDDDVTEFLGIQKWEPPIPAELSGQVVGLFPSFIPKTDQERIQNFEANVFVENINSEYEVSMKLDGTSMTSFYYSGNHGTCSRNWQLKVNNSNAGNTIVRTYIDSGLQEILCKYGKNIAVQGELMGPGIQANRESLKSHKLFVFDIYDIDNGCYLSPDARYMVMDELYNLGLNQDIVMQVPILFKNVTLGNLGINNVDDCLRFAEGPSIINSVREGVVFKRRDGRFSFKAISNYFLLKNGD